MGTARRGDGSEHGGRMREPQLSLSVLLQKLRCEIARRAEEEEEEDLNDTPRACNVSGRIGAAFVSSCSDR